MIDITVRLSWNAPSFDMELDPEESFTAHDILEDFREALGTDEEGFPSHDANNQPYNYQVFLEVESGQRFLLTTTTKDLFQQISEQESIDSMFISREVATNQQGSDMKEAADVNAAQTVAMPTAQANNMAAPTMQASPQAQPQPVSEPPIYTPPQKSNKSWMYFIPVILILGLVGGYLFMQDGKSDEIKDETQELIDKSDNDPGEGVSPNKEKEKPLFIDEPLEKLLTRFEQAKTNKGRRRLRKSIRHHFESEKTMVIIYEGGMPVEGKEFKDFYEYLLIQPQNITLSILEKEENGNGKVSSMSIDVNASFEEIHQ